MLPLPFFYYIRRYFIGFKEFTNPEENNYDIKCGLKSQNNMYINKPNKYFEELFDLIGILEDVTEDELQEQYGISMSEYFKPTIETIIKVIQKLNSNQNSRHR